MDGVIAYLSVEGIDDELNMFGRNPLNSFLNHMVTVLISHACHHVMLELLNQLSLLISKYVLQGLGSLASISITLALTHLLNDPTTIHLCR